MKYFQTEEYLLSEGDVAPVTARVVLGQEDQEVVGLDLVVALVRVDLVAGLVDAEGEDLAGSLGERPHPHPHGLLGEVQLDVLRGTFVQPSQTGEVELHELLTLVPGCNVTGLSLVNI